MPYGLYISAEGAQAQAHRLDVITNNLANVNTPGFKRQFAIFQARFAEAIQQGAMSPGTGSIEDVGGGVAFRETKTDFTPASLKRTEIPTDMAIPNEGFFVVRKGRENMLTRAGNFQLTPTGQLLTPQGYPVLDDGNSPILIQPNGGPWKVSSDGTILQAGTTQRLAIVKPKSLGDLVQAGENLYRSLAPVQQVLPEKRWVSPGYIEVSGVEPTMEMTAMVEASRLFEANVNLMRAQDQMLGGLVNRLLKV